MRTVWFIARQFLLVTGAALSYFAVRNITEGKQSTADKNARRLLDLEESIGVAVERSIQEAIEGRELIVDLSNWIYIWGHWPVLIGSLLWLAIAHRDDYYFMRNAMFISGGIGIVIFALLPMTPPRLFGIEYVDTVTERSNSYRVLQPPGLVNPYAAMPSLHFGWNLLAGIMWFRLGRSRWWGPLGVTMPLAMAWAVVATANHWVLDVVGGAIVALSGLTIEWWWASRRRLRGDDGDGGDGGDGGGEAGGAETVSDASGDVDTPPSGTGGGVVAGES
ncbi:MAG: phosphatase PAP2 family protein [Ilumatobacter sp.]|uniref:phosphatase PAP2 family protein n=1 Tax=Ilumatobacter sp. TaxID=1967498 RepID=UPI0026398D02|nr:phosphatase PAP2 family protein [Ilumatobacter sp.]MDJ0771708.1 phosphatase PAP2 family protein [Ilumatobacter sp.]